MSANKTTDVQAVLRRLESGRNDSHTGAKRRFKRFAVRTEAMLWSGEANSGSQSPIPVQLRDVSRGGAGFLSNQPASLGDYWHMQLIDGTLAMATLPVFCRFCHQVADGAFLVGVEFGLEASVLLALGVTAKEIANNDIPEQSQQLSGEFVDPQSLDS